MRALLGRLAAKWKSSRRASEPAPPPPEDFERFVLVLKEHSSHSNPQLHGLALFFAVKTFVAVLRSFVTDSDRAQAQVSKAMDVCESEGISMQDALERLGIEHDESLLATIAMLVMARKDSANVLFTMYGHLLTGGIKPARETEGWATLCLIVEAMSEILGDHEDGLKNDAPSDEDHSGDTFSSYRGASRRRLCMRIAYRLFEAGRIELATRIILVGINSLFAGYALDRLQLARTMFSYGARATDERLRMSTYACLVGLSTAVERYNNAVGLVAMDSVYDVALETATSDSFMEYHANIFEPYFKAGVHPALSALIRLQDPRLDRTNFPPDLRNAKLRPLVLAEEFTSWMASIVAARDLLLEFENARLKLEPKVDDIAQTEWASHAFRVPAFQRALPYAESFLRTQDAAQILLVLKHELVHVVCISGGIGLALAALRAAVVGLERSFEVDSDEESHDSGEVLQPGTLTLMKKLRETTDNLSLAEAQIDCLRKVQILQDVWGPWLEGVAVFAELHAIPSDVKDTWAVWTTPMPNLVDFYLKQDDTHEAVLQRILAWNSELESLSQRASDESGYFRLRSYIRTYRNKYLAGYFAVRAVVSSWRNACGASLNGELAARLLVEATRGISTDAIPSLDLPHPEFETQAVALMSAWVRARTSMAPEELHRFIAEHSSNVSKLQPIVSLEETIETLETFNSQVLAILQRRATEPEGSRSPLAAIRKALPDFDLQRATLESWRSHAVLPIAEVMAPFWLNTAGNQLLLFLRTIEISTSGNAAYRPIMLGLSKAETTALAEQIAVRREARMRVVRFIDMASNRPDNPDHFGMQALALQYGTFIALRSVGVLAGAPVEKLPQSLLYDVRKKFLDPEVELDQREIGGELVSPAARINWWLHEREKWGSELMNCAAVVQRRESLSALAYEVVEAGRGERVIDTSESLLELAFPSSSMREILLSQGLDGLVGDSGRPLQTLLKILHESGRAPLQEIDIADVEGADVLFVRGPHGVDFRAVDSTHFDSAKEVGYENQLSGRAARDPAGIGLGGLGGSG